MPAVRAVYRNCTKRLLKLPPDVTATMFASGWFLPVFVRVLPWSSLLRVMDLLLFGETVSQAL